MIRRIDTPLPADAETSATARSPSPASTTDAATAHEFWQEVVPAGTYACGPGAVHRDAYPAVLPDGRQLLLPLRVRDGGRTRLASLILNQASFAVQDLLAEALAERIAIRRPDVVVGVPTLGLPLAEQVARRLGHSRFVALGTSRKFWYDESLSVPLTSVTSPGQAKRLYLDPRLRPLLAGRRVALIDDVISTGSSMTAALGLLALVGTAPVAIGCAMLQGERWREALPNAAGTGEEPIAGVLRTPILEGEATGSAGS